MPVRAFLREGVRFRPDRYRRTSWVPGLDRAATGCRFSATALA